MRHKLGHRILNKSTSHRKAMFANMAASLIEHEQIVTTLPKAKEMAPLMDKLVTLAKKGDLAARRQALSMVGDDLAWRLDRDAVSAMMMQAAQEEMPIMCFVGNKGCIQIHSGPVANIKTMGPWLNVMDPGFHLHLRTDRIAELWGVRKPNSDGHVTSLEAYDADGTMVIQFFGKRHEGKNERPDWRRLAEQLPRLPDRTAA